MVKCNIDLAYLVCIKGGGIMALSKQEKDLYIQNVVLKHFNFLRDAPIGALLVDTEYKIIAVNELCRQRFDGEELVGRSNITLYDEANPILLDKADSHGVSYSRYVKMQNKIRLRLHQVVFQDKIPIQFICYMPHPKEFISLLAHYIPVFHDSGEVVAIQIFASEFSFWGLNEYLNFLDMQPVRQVTILQESNNLPVKLTPRQHEILFLLAFKTGQRQAATILNISYGNLSKIVRDIICPKFNIYDADVTKLQEMAVQMGYHKYIPQSLCRPVVIVLDNRVWDKYFVGDEWIFPNWTTIE